MSEASNVYELINPSNTSTFNRFLSLATSCHAAVIYGALLSKSYYYKKRGMTKDGWFYSSSNDLEESTGISLCSQRTAIKILVSKGLIKCERKGLPSKRSFLVLEDVDALNELLKIGEQKGRSLNPIAYVDKDESNLKDQTDAKERSNLADEVSCEEFECYKRNADNESSNIQHSNNNKNSSTKSTTSKDKFSPHTYNNLKENKSTVIINPSIVQNADVNDRIDTNKKASVSYLDVIKENIGYEYLCSVYKYDKEQIDGIVGIMADVVCSDKGTIRVCGENKSAEAVKSVFLKLDESHIQYVMDSMKQNTTKIRNIRSYLITALYNSKFTINSYYQSLVNHDMYAARLQ